MVNVGGRSKGCSTCRKRRVKCDEHRPICYRCMRHGLQCDGGQDWIFVAQSGTRKSRKPGRSGNQTSLTSKHRVADPDLTLMPTFNLKGLEAQVYICYAQQHLLRRGPVGLAFQELQLSDVIAAEDPNAQATLFHRALLSLATVFFGSQHKQDSIRQRGYALYGNTLTLLNSALSDPKSYLRDEVLLTVVSLVLFEAFAPTGPNRFLTHIAGLERLVELRGPARHCPPGAFQVYKGLRRMLLFASLITRRPTILAREEWKEYLQSNCQRDELEDQFLSSLLADCTILVADLDAAKTSCQDNAEFQEADVTQRALKILQKLQRWRSSWDAKNRPHHSTNTQAASKKERLAIFLDGFATLPPKALTFTSHSAVLLLMLYNTTLIYVLRILSASPPRSAHSSSTEPTLLQLSEHMPTYKTILCDLSDDFAAAEHFAALEICRCFPYHLSHKHLLNPDTVMIGHIAMRTAVTTLGGKNSSKFKWVFDMLNDDQDQAFARGLWTD